MSKPRESNVQVAYRGVQVNIIQGDITDQETDAIVNAANTHLAGGGGVDGAIHRVGGPEIMEECRRLGRCQTGSAVATGAGKLKAKHVFHAVAPRWSGGNQNEPALLSGAYRRSLELADEVGAASIAFPSLGTGAYGYPVDEAASIATWTVCEYIDQGTSLKDVTFVLFTCRDREVFADALTATIDDLSVAE
jgi:O-acetyl-ADP-ribose deacetylase